MTRRSMIRACEFLSIAMLAAGMLTACSTIETGAYAGERASFADYQTFSWINADPYVAADGAAPVSSLGVDIFDNETGRPVWHGWAMKTVTEQDRQNRGPTIEKGIAQLFAAFPG